jgi:hypothetical protein
MRLNCLSRSKICLSEQTYKSYQKTRNCKNLLQFLHKNCTNCGDPDPREEGGSKALGEGFHGPIDPQEDKWIRWVAQHEFYACFCQTALTPNYSTHNCFFFFFFIDLDESSSFLFL